MTRHEGAAMIRRLGKALGKALGPALRVALSGGLLSAGCAWAEVSRYCPAGGPIRFAHYEFGLIYSEARQGGVDADVQQELQRRSGCAFQLSLQPRARTWSDLRSGHIDMAGSGVQTPERDGFAWFAHYVVEDNQVLLAHSVPPSVRSLEDFERHPDLRMGVVRSFSFSPRYDAAVQRLRAAGRLYEVSDSATLYRMFASRRFEAFIASQFLYGHYLKRFSIPVPRRIEDWDPDPATPSGLVIAKHRFSAEQAQAWQRLVQSLLDDGTLRRILVKHLGEQGAERALYRPTPH
jgi:polar amino acid transport system substrate-binding protein